MQTEKHTLWEDTGTHLGERADVLGGRREVEAQFPPSPLLIFFQLVLLHSDLDFHEMLI